MQTDLKTIPYIGKEIKQDLCLIGIHFVEDLKGKKPEVLYEQVSKIKGYKEDRCLLYVFRMAVYYANTAKPDEDKLKWWYWKDKEGSCKDE